MSFTDCVADLCLIFKMLNIDKALTQHFCQTTDAPYPSISKKYRDKIIVGVMHLNLVKGLLIWVLWQVKYVSHTAIT